MNRKSWEPTRYGNKQTMWRNSPVRGIKPVLACESRGATSKYEKKNVEVGVGGTHSFVFIFNSHIRFTLVISVATSSCETQAIRSQTRRCHERAHYEPCEQHVFLFSHGRAGSGRNVYSRQRKSSYPRNRPWRPIGLWDVKDPTLSRQSAHRWRLGCQPHAPAALYSPETLFFLMFPVLISIRGSVNPRA
jgi:hypothetical protein